MNKDANIAILLVFSLLCGFVAGREVESSYESQKKDIDLCGGCVDFVEMFAASLYNFIECNKIIEVK
jgi:hypothetical protein